MMTYTGRYVNVARFNFEKSPGLAKKFSTFSVPMIYRYTLTHADVCSRMLTYADVC